MIQFFSSGASGIILSEESKTVQNNFSQAVIAICSCLAKKCVTDGEKVTKFVKIIVEDAVIRIQHLGTAHSQLSIGQIWYGSDPNWGQVMRQAMRKWDFFRKAPATIHLCSRRDPLISNKSNGKIVSASEFQFP